MTLMFAPVVGLVAGAVLGRRREGYALTGLVWYVAQAAQTTYLAKPGATDFGGHGGNATVGGWLYWLVQPPILGLAIALLLVGAVLRARFVARLQRGTAMHEPS